MKSFIVVVAMVFSSLVFADSHDDEKVQCDSLGCWRLIESDQEMEQYCTLGITRQDPDGTFYCLVSMPGTDDN